MEQVPPSPPLIPSALIPQVQPEPSESWQLLLPWNNILNPPPLSLSSLSPFLWKLWKARFVASSSTSLDSSDEDFSSITVRERLIVTERALGRALSFLWLCGLQWITPPLISQRTWHQSLKSDTSTNPSQQRCCINHHSWVSLWRGNKRHINGKGNSVKYILLVEKYENSPDRNLFFFLFIMNDYQIVLPRDTKSKHSSAFFFHIKITFLPFTLTTPELLKCH